MATEDLELQLRVIRESGVQLAYSYPPGHPMTGNVHTPMPKDEADLLYEWMSERFKAWTGTDIAMYQVPTIMMSESEIISFMAVIDRVVFSAEMDTCDAVCYGSEARAAKAGEEERACLRILDAIPDHVKAEIMRRRQKAKADALRAQADQIENGI